MAVIIDDHYIADGSLDRYATFVGEDIFLGNCAHPHEANPGDYCVEATGHFFQRVGSNWFRIPFEKIPPYIKAWVILMGWKTEE